jgi:hypothetical protein
MFNYVTIAVVGQTTTDGEIYVPKIAAAVWAISMSLDPAPLTATAPTISPSE